MTAVNLGKPESPAAEVDVDVEEVAAVAGERIARAAGVAWRRISAVVANPPDIWSNEQPPLRALWEYSLQGEYTAAGPGVVRSLHLVYTLFAMAITGLAYLVMWIAQRPTRLILGAPAVLIIDAAASTLPYVGWLAPDVLNPFAWF